MTQYLPPNLLALFAARDPLQYLVPPDKLPHEKKRVPYSGVGTFLNWFEDPKDTPPPTRVETRDERKERKRKERQEQHAYKLEQDLALWDPGTNPSSTMDPFKSLFVARINFDTSESKLRREFEVYGSVKKICLINDRQNGKPRGYAFIEYEHERDMHSAYKHADGKKIDGRRVLVDVERGRTVKGWRPRRLGGGLGGTRKGGPDENTRFSGRDEFGAAGAADKPGFRGGDDDRAPPRRERSRSRERRRRSRSKEQRRRSRSPRERRDNRRSRSRERRRGGSRERPDRGDAEVVIPVEEEDVKESRRDKKRNRRSRSRDRAERRRSRSRDRKRSKRSRSKERKHKIKEEGQESISMFPPMGPEAGGDADGVNNGDQEAYRDEEEIKVKEEKPDAYMGYGGQQAMMDREKAGGPPQELEEGEED